MMIMLILLLIAIVIVIKSKIENCLYNDIIVYSKNG